MTPKPPNGPNEEDNAAKRLPREYSHLPHLSGRRIPHTFSMHVYAAIERDLYALEADGLITLRGRTCELTPKGQALHDLHFTRAAS